jgi:hypothetical protein
VPKGPKSGRASLKTRKGRTSFKTRKGLVIIKTSKASLNLKRALWRDKPSGLLPENCPNFSFFFVWAGQALKDALQLLISLAVVILIMTKLKSRRQVSTLVILIMTSPYFGYFNYGQEKLLKFFVADHKTSRKLK